MKMSVIKHHKGWHQQFIVTFTIYMLMKNSRHLIWIFSHPSVIINIYICMFNASCACKVSKWVHYPEAK